MGYAVVNVDVRGRYESEGTWDPFRAEAKDGYDVVEWAAKQPWTNGKVATQGGSYLGHTQWATLGEAPPSLVAAFPAVASTNLYANWVTQGGAFHLAFNFGWARRPDAVPDHAAAVVLHRPRRGARAALRAAAHAPAARDDGRAGLPASGEALARLGDARQLRRLLEGGQRRGEVRQGQRAGHDAGRLVRHLPARDDRRLRGRAQARRQRAGTVAHADGDRALGPRPVAQVRRPRLRARRRPHALRLRDALARLPPEGREERHRHRRAGADLLHGREQVAWRSGMARAGHAAHALVPAARRQARARGADGGRRLDDLPLRPERSGADDRRQQLLRITDDRRTGRSEAARRPCRHRPLHERGAEGTGDDRGHRWRWTCTPRPTARTPTGW